MRELQRIIIPNAPIITKKLSKSSNYHRALKNSFSQTVLNLSNSHTSQKMACMLTRESESAHGL